MDGDVNVGGIDQHVWMKRIGMPTGSILCWDHSEPESESKHDSQVYGQALSHLSCVLSTVVPFQLSGYLLLHHEWYSLQVATL